MTFSSSFSSDFKRNYVFLDPSKYQGPGLRLLFLMKWVWPRLPASCQPWPSSCKEVPGGLPRKPRGGRHRSFPPAQPRLHAGLQAHRGAS